jgi:hypothetical protein
MKRIACVVLFALMTAAISGMNDASAARTGQSAQTDDAHRQAIAAQLKQIPLDSVVRIDQTDGRRFDAVLKAITADAVVVAILEGPSRQQTTIRIDDIRRIERLRGHTLRNVLIVAGVGAAILVGACAAALNNVNNAEGSLAAPPAESHSRP